MKGFYENYPGLFVPATSILTIDGDGSLNASSNGFGAGIGGGYYGASCGVINIQGGNITAIGGKYSAGIGSSHRNSCSHIIVSGGTIDVTGQSSFDYDGTAQFTGGTIIVNGRQVTSIPNQMMGGGGFGGGGMGGGRRR